MNKEESTLSFSKKHLKSLIDKRKRNRELFIVAMIVPFIILLTYIESHISVISGDLPVATNIFILGLINLNIILLVFLIFLVLRIAVKLYMESKRKVLGSKLKTKLVVSFFAFTAIPTFVLFFVVISFINRSIDAWFELDVEVSLEEALKLGQSYYMETSDDIFIAARQISKTVTRENYSLTGGDLRGYIDLKISDEDFSSVEVYDDAGERVYYAISTTVSPNMVPDVEFDAIGDALKGKGSNYVQTISYGDVIRGVSPVFTDESNNKKVRGVIAVSYYVPINLIGKMKDISDAFEGYKQLKILKNPVKTTYFTIILIITLVIIFLSIWIGTYIAKGITVPIQELAEGTHAIASGDLDYRIDIESKDEIGVLVNSFNRMTEDLKSGKSELENANLNLRTINKELDGRRNYIEIVLSNIPAGVISIDKSNTITSMNKIASHMLDMDLKSSLGKKITDVMRSEDVKVVLNMIKEMSELEAENLEKEITIINKDNVEMKILVNLNALTDDKNNYIGLVAVLDDMSHIIKSQRMSAWKEVAKRIAHEIKNPLTPIKLSAQRLRKKYLDSFDDPKVFDECTKTIINQVEDLRVLVNEFSNFARMPASNPSLNNLNELLKEVLALYSDGSSDVVFTCDLSLDVPLLEIDKDQMKRVFINLIDNAAASIEGRGTVSVNSRYNKELDMVFIVVSDTGTGIPEETKARLFEPYFSTKKTGTGLGLAIVNTIIADHNGYIRVKDNDPKGTKFIIELPVKAVKS